MAYNYFALEFTTSATLRHSGKYLLIYIYNILENTYSKVISNYNDSFLGSYDLSFLTVFKLSILIQFEAYFNTSVLSGSFFQEAIKNRCCLYFICLIQPSCKGGEMYVKIFVTLWFTKHHKIIQVFQLHIMKNYLLHHHRKSVIPSHYKHNNIFSVNASFKPREDYGVPISGKYGREWYIYIKIVIPALVHYLIPSLICPCISPFCNSRRGKIMNADSKVKLSSVSLLTPLKLQWLFLCMPEPFIFTSLSYVTYFSSLHPVLQQL